MAIQNAKSIAGNRAKTNAPKVSRKSSGQRSDKRATSGAPLSDHGDRSATLRLYVKDKELLKRAKIAAIEEDVSLSQLWEEWATDWLNSR